MVRCEESGRGYAKAAAVDGRATRAEPAGTSPSVITAGESH